MRVFEYLEDSVAKIKRLGAILCGDEAGDGETWQRVAFAQSHEMRHYAEVLESVARGEKGGGIAFPSWDEGWASARTEPPMPSESVACMLEDEPGVMPERAKLQPDFDQRSEIIMRQDDRIAEMARSAGNMASKWSQTTTALAVAASALREGADTLARFGGLPPTAWGCLAVEARLRNVADLATATIEGCRRS